MAVALITLLSACQAPPPPEGLTDADRAAINELDAAYAAAALAGDWAALGGLWTEDAVYQVPEGPAIRGRDAIVAAFQGGPIPTEMVTNISASDGSGNWAWVRGTWRWVAAATEDMPEMRSEGSFLWVLEKQPEGAWLIDTECYNLDAPGETPTEG